MNKLKLFFRISIKEQTLFAKRLSFLVHSGLPLRESLRILHKQTQSPTMKEVMDKIISDVENGQYLSTSMAKFRKIFGDFTINLIRVGETGGILDQNLNYLAEELNKKQILRRKVVGSMVYPIVIIIATLGITGLLTVFIFPKILPIFSSLNVKLPLATRILIFISNFLLHYGIYVALGIVGLGILFTWLMVKKANVQLFVDRFILRIPLIGSLMLNYQVANFCRTLGLLLKSSIKIVEAVSITADTMTSAVFKKELHEIGRNVAKGERLSVNLEKHAHLFPVILSQMISVGEISGNLSETLIYLSELYESEVEELTKSLSSAIEPVLMVFMGLIVGFIAVSIITPIYQITQNLHP